jgi:hypothetical protein
MEYNVVHGSFCAKANHPVKLGGDFAWTAVEQWRTFEMVAGGITSPSVKVRRQLRRPPAGELAVANHVCGEVELVPPVD